MKLIPFLNINIITFIGQLTIYIVNMTKPKYASLKDVPKYQYFGKKRYPIPMKKRIDMYLNQS